ncbi:MAG: hypothetical protein ACPG4T_21480 [Nannocystaceae bacterium]
MQGSYYCKVIPPQSPASVGEYCLEIRAEGRFELLCRILQNTPEERDWRSEWNSSEGTVRLVDGKLEFVTEVSTWEVRSSAWKGRGVERDTSPDERFTGEVSTKGIRVSRLSGLLLSKVDSVELSRGLILPDYGLW